MKKVKNRFPKGWDEKKVKALIRHYENQSEDQAAADDEAAYHSTRTTIDGSPGRTRAAGSEAHRKTRELSAEDGGFAGPDGSAVLPDIAGGRRTSTLSRSARCHGPRRPRTDFAFPLLCDSLWVAPTSIACSTETRSAHLSTPPARTGTCSVCRLRC